MLNYYKHHLYLKFPNMMYSDKLWLVLTYVLGNISSGILTNTLTKEGVESNIATLLYITVKIAILFNVDLDKSWKKWKSKLKYKNYTSSSLTYVSSVIS